MAVSEGDRSSFGYSTVIMFLAGCYTLITVAAVLMGYDSYLVLAAGSFLGALVGYNVKESIDQKRFDNLKTTYINMMQSYQRIVEQYAGMAEEKRTMVSAEGPGNT